ncbi:hypothetical protein Syun_004523 [Stephania yunnanensis]|uniref:Uncharacterized protein n=1 Tax=Stephania yunnanensis TaxID=152371 RepID=A0AAP0L3N0_9MAGN
MSMVEARSGQERRAGEADQKSGWSVVMDDDDGSVSGRWLALATTGHATTMGADARLLKKKTLLRLLVIAAAAGWGNLLNTSVIDYIGGKTLVLNKQTLV